jgi:hypothetical protein
MHVVIATFEHIWLKVLMFNNITVITLTTCVTSFIKIFSSFNTLLKTWSFLCMTQWKIFPCRIIFLFHSGTKDLACSEHCYCNISAKSKTKIPGLTFFTTRKWSFQKSPLVVVVSGKKREEILPYILPQFTYVVFIADAKVCLCEKISIFQRVSVDWSRTACQNLCSTLTVSSYGRQRNDLQYFKVSWVMCTRLSSEYSN